VGLKRQGAVADISKLPPKKRRAVGVDKYTTEDVDAILNILDGFLPLGDNAWNFAGDCFNEWASENGRPRRTVKSLKLKFKQVRPAL
jgi:hypothetical protein